MRKQNEILSKDEGLVNRFNFCSCIILDTCFTNFYGLQKRSIFTGRLHAKHFVVLDHIVDRDLKLWCTRESAPHPIISKKCDVTFDAVRLNLVEHGFKSFESRLSLRDSGEQD